MSIKRIKKNLKMDNLHFLPNNILTRLFKVLKNYKNYYCRDRALALSENVAWTEEEQIIVGGPNLKSH